MDVFFEKGDTESSLEEIHRRQKAFCRGKGYRKYTRQSDFWGCVSIYLSSSLIGDKRHHMAAFNFEKM